MAVAGGGGVASVIAATKSCGPRRRSAAATEQLEAVAAFLKSVGGRGTQIPTTNMECGKPRNIESGQASRGVVVGLLFAGIGAARLRHSSATLVPARHPTCL